MSMVLNTLIYIALVIIVIIVIVVLLRFLFGVLFIVPTSMGHQVNMLRDVASQSIVCYDRFGDNILLSQRFPTLIVL
jgi:hypothetical protein